MRTMAMASTVTISSAGQTQDISSPTPKAMAMMPPLNRLPPIQNHRRFHNLISFYARRFNR